LISPTGKPIALAPTRANVGIEYEYRRKLDALIDEMNHSVLYWIGFHYDANEPEIAKLARDASPARTLLDALRELRSRWERRFSDLAGDLARWFAINVKDRSDTSLRASLRRAGFTVRFQTTRAVNDALRATIGENVSLIKSIPSEYLTQVEGHVMRSVQMGRDLGALARTIEYEYGVTRRRAALISRDQNNKATAVVTRVRQQELGITEAVWVHSHAGKVPRPSHVKAGRDRIRYAIATGWFDPDEGEYVWPGTLINCRCVARPIIPGFE
jgi:uncharacterized protein with gpF-like domain